MYIYKVKRALIKEVSCFSDTKNIIEYYQIDNIVYYIQ